MAFCCAGYLLCRREVEQSRWVSAFRGSYCSEISGSCLRSWEGLLTMLGFFHVPERVPAGKRPLTIFICVFVFTV